MSQFVVMPVEEFQSLVRESIRRTLHEELKNFNQTPEVMREKEAAKYLGLTPNTLRQYRVRGTGPVYSKTGSVITYLKSDLDFYLQQAKVKTFNR